jgi:hypothetical protein
MTTLGLFIVLCFFNSYEINGEFDHPRLNLDRIIYDTPEDGVQLSLPFETSLIRL